VGSGRKGTLLLRQ